VIGYTLLMAAGYDAITSKFVAKACLLAKREQVRSPAELSVELDVSKKVTVHVETLTAH
jgi:hypothetical protein